MTYRSRQRQWAAPFVLGFAMLMVGPCRGNESSGAVPVGHPAEEQAAKPTTATSDWSMQSNCSGCHTRNAASAEDGVHLAAKHAKTACTTCHRDEATLRTAHADLTKPPAQTWLNAPISNDVCFRCHESWESLAGLTKSSRALVDKNGKVINPHLIPRTPSHNQKPFCFVCHTMHLDAKQPGDYCFGCHHERVFECNTCHTLPYAGGTSG